MMLNLFSREDVIVKKPFHFTLGIVNFKLIAGVT
jgi:hypothetical protein